MPYCRECGTEVRPDTSYCPDCGEKLNFGSTEKDEDPPEATTAEETETAVTESQSEPEPYPGTEQESGSEIESTIETEPEEDSPGGVSIWAKLGVIICIPIALAGIVLEVASVYTLSIGEYTSGEFAIVSLIFGVVTFLPIAYIYWVYSRSTWSARGLI